jgi:hypothetical protein
MNRYVWKGPPTALELWSQEAGASAPIFEAFATPGAELPAPLDPDHPIVKGWIAFGLIEQAASAPLVSFSPRTDTAEPLASSAAEDAGRKEKRNG